MANILDEQVGTIASGFWYADLLVQLWSGPTVNPMDARLSAQTGASTTVSWTGQNADLCPPVYYGVSGDYTLILVSCVQSLNMAINLMNGYATPALIEGAKENAWAKAAAQWIVQTARERHMPSTTKYVLAGYSGGGMICQSLAQALSGSPDGPSVRLSTFGSPREAQASICNALAHQDVIRWMNNDDPVPLIPPRIGQVPGFAALLPYALAQEYVGYDHCKNGANLDPDGSRASATLPRDASLSPTASLASFLLQQVGGGGGGHRIQEYRSRLDTALQNVPVVDNPPRPTPVEPDDGFSRGEWGSEAAAGATAVFRQGEAQTAVGLIVPDEYLPVVVKQGRIWSVYWLNNFIATGPKKKRALHFKRTLTDLIRSLMIQGVVEPDALLSSIQLFTQAAATEGNGFQPVMQDEFPTE